MVPDVTSSRTWSSVHLDAVRGVAAIVVMLGHSRDLYFSSITGIPHGAQGGQKPETVIAAVSSQASAPFAKETITIGNEMVIIFFVLSGYLVGGSVLNTLKRRTWSWKDYLIKRLTRLWVVLLPALVLGLALDLLGLHLFGGPGSIYAGPQPQAIVHPGIEARMHWSLLWGNTAFLQGIFVPLLGTNDSLWSLANEFWYYVAFPAMLLPFSGKLSPHSRWAAVAIFLLLAATVGPAVAALFPTWIAGALLSQTPRKLPRKTAEAATATLAVMLPFVCVAVRKLPVERWLAQYMIAAYSVVLLWVILHQTRRARVGLYSGLCGFFSRLSYTLYLFHVPILVFFTAVVNRPWRVLALTPANFAKFALVNFATILIAAGLYYLFEAHTDQVRDVFLRRHRPETEGTPTQAETLLPLKPTLPA